MTFFMFIAFCVGVVYFFSRLSNKKDEDTSFTQNKQTTEGPNIVIKISGPGFVADIDRKPDDYKWIPPGVSTTIQGYQIPGGMIYVGNHLKSVSAYSMEPGFIKTNLSVDNSKIDREGSNLNYWPSYTTIPPASRAAYLEWLAGGRMNPNINIGYVFLFFYGLERRLLYDATQTTVSQNEIQAIITELQRLRSIYSPLNGSFNHYVNAFLEFLELKNTQTKFYELTPPASKYTYEISPIIKLALGQLVIEGQSIPPHWMYEYARHHPEINLRTPAKRCPEEFKKLFLIFYQKKYNEGITLKPAQSKVKMEYHCASSGFVGKNNIKTWDIPDVTGQKPLLNKICNLVEECQLALEKYSRWIG